MSYKEEKRHSLRYVRLPSLWEVSIFFLLIYAFFVQYGVLSISNVMLMLNGICIILGIASTVTRPYKVKRTFYAWIIIFVVVSVLLSVIFGVSFSASLDTGIRMIEYCLTGLSVFLFCTLSKKKYKAVLFYTWLSILLLAVNVLLNGTEVDYLGAIGLGALNTNEMSSFFILMVFCTFCLYAETENKFQKIIIWLSLLLVFIIQIRSASRRGFIVMVVMIVLNIIFAVIPYNNQNKSKRKLATYSLAILLGGIVFVSLRNYILSNTILGERLVGVMTGGDVARAQKHNNAPWPHLLQS